jgi:hypothetical protein
MEVGSRMHLPFACRVCGHVNHAEWSQIGQKLPCGGCGRTLTVPAPMETAGKSPAPASVTRFACPACGRKFATQADLAGKKIRCSGCGAGVRVPLDDETPVAPSSRPALKTYGDTGNSTAAPRPARGQDRATRADVHPAANGQGDDSSSLLDELESLEGLKRPRRAAAILPSRAEVMEQARQAVVEQEAIEATKTVAKAKKKKKKKKKTGYFDPKDTLILVGGLGAFVAVLAFFAYAYPGLRFPLGGLLCVVGFIVYLLGAASVRQLVAEEGAFKVLLFRFFPPYQLWFVATRWAETKDFVALFGAGLVMLSIGGAVLKTSPIGKKAEESERAYQEARQGSQDGVPPAVSSGIADDGG